MKTRIFSYIKFALVVVHGACAQSSSPPPPATTTSPIVTTRVATRASTAPSTSTSVTAQPYTESDFTESDSSRDPFRSFDKTLAPANTVVTRPQYAVALERFSIEELRLIAIATTPQGTKAMFVDPKGKGWTVQRGTHIGRGELLKVSNNQNPTALVHWRIDRIRPNEVVLVKQDPMHPEIPPTYKEIPLHLEADKAL